ncbi:MAG TPA: hypothetical protein VK887_06280, partial [Pseudonocardiaceae bacterium]|nr:hypothetical protein [Pseudonocardiaceae bacterium]
NRPGGGELFCLITTLLDHKFAPAVVAIQLVPLTSAARCALLPTRRRAARRRSSVGGQVPVLRAAAACALWLVGLV